jgi:hypothetical protein
MGDILNGWKPSMYSTQPAPATQVPIVPTTQAPVDPIKTVAPVAPQVQLPAFAVRNMDPNNRGFMGWLAGGQDKDKNVYGGLGMPALQIAQGALSAWSGYQQNKTAKDTLNFQKNAFSQNFAMQKELVKNELRDRQHSRYLFDPKSHKPPDEYMSSLNLG